MNIVLLYVLKNNMFMKTNFKSGSREAESKSKWYQIGALVLLQNHSMNPHFWQFFDEGVEPTNPHFLRIFASHDFSKFEDNQT